jgi:hypothetical protein
MNQNLQGIKKQSSFERGGGGEVFSGIYETFKVTFLIE